MTTAATPLVFSLVLLALGGAGLLLPGRWAILALAVQWLGLALAGMVSPGGDLTMSRAGGVELVTALVCAALLWLMLRAAERTGQRPATPPAPRRRAYAADYALPLAVLFLGGMAGLGLAALFPLGDNTQVDLAFYWSVIAAAVVIILDGVRDPVKAALALLVLLNSASLLVLTLSVAVPGAGVLGLLALARIALVLLLGYGWVWLKRAYGELSLEPLFGRRDEALSTALVPVQPPGLDGIHDEPSDPLEAVEDVETQEAR